MNRNASLGHHVRLEPYVSIGPGATVAARCQIGKGTMVGAGSVIAPGVRIGENCLLVVGSVVTRDVKNGTIMVANPATVKRTGISGYRSIAEE